MRTSGERIQAFKLLAHGGSDGLVSVDSEGRTIRVNMNYVTRAIKVDGDAVSLRMVDGETLVVRCEWDDLLF